MGSSVVGTFTSRWDATVECRSFNLRGIKVDRAITGGGGQVLTWAGCGDTETMSTESTFFGTKQQACEGSEEKNSSNGNSLLSQTGLKFSQPSRTRCFLQKRSKKR